MHKSRFSQVAPFLVLLVVLLSSLACGGSTTQQIASAVAPTTAGLDYRQFAGHSLCSGFIATAYTAGASVTDIAKVSGQKSLDVLRSPFRIGWQGATRSQ